MRRAGLAVLAVVGLAACGSSAAHVALPKEEPSPASSWPKAPSFPVSSCWTRKTGGGVEAYAPQYRPAAHGSRDPKVILSRLLGGFGDRSIIHGASLGSRPEATRIHHGYFPNNPSENGLWLYVDAPDALQSAKPSPNGQLAEWEVYLLTGGLRDALCLAGSRPLLAWSTKGGNGAAGFSDESQPFGQRFPNPEPAAFRSRVSDVARAFGMHVVAVRLLRPFQLAPEVILAAKDRKVAAREAEKIDELLDPTRGGAQTFEGFYLELRDAKGPFIRLAKTFRGQAMGSEWAWDRCYLPDSSLGDLYGAKPCTKGSPQGG